MTGIVLSVAGLCKTFTRGSGLVAAADNVSFCVKSGETLALCGPSGSGKSTIARLVMRLLDPDSGRIVLGGQDLTALRGEALRRQRSRFQMVFQDSTAALNPRATVYDAVAAPLRIHNIGRRTDRACNVGKLLEQVGLSAVLSARAIHEISGGQRQRVAIARALASKPDLVVLDESLSAIDPSLRLDVLRLFLDLQQRRSIAFLFISHDVALVRAFAHKVAFIEHGKIVEQGRAVDVIDQPQSALARAMIAAVPRLKEL